MVNIDVLFLSQQAENTSLKDQTVIVIDVLRATSTMVTALHSGARGVVPVASVDDARRVAREHPESLLGGERGGVPLPGFEAGNSPYEYMDDSVAGRLVVLTTTNGTLALERAVQAEAEEIAIGALINAYAVAQWAVERGDDLTLLCAGTEGVFGLDDTAGAGCIVRHCMDLQPSARLTDAARAAKMLWEPFAEDPPTLFEASYHGRRLIELGFGKDLDYCARVDSVPVVGVLGDQMITLHQ